MKITMVAMTAALFLAAADRTSAQDCGDCFEERGAHVAIGNYYPFSEYTEGHGQHDWIPYAGYCDLAHGFCIGGKEDLEELTAQVERAVAASDAAGVLALMSLESVQVNWARGAVQVMSCDGESVFAHVPVGGTLLVALQDSALEQMSDRFEG